MCKTKYLLGLILIGVLIAPLCGTDPKIDTQIMDDTSIYAAWRGDVDEDGRVDIVDALMVVQYYVGLITTLPNNTKADVNGDDSIDIIDALMIAQYYVGLLPSGTFFPPYNLNFTSTAGGPDDVWFESVGPLVIGEVFTTEIYINTRSDACCAYGFQVDYDPTILEIQSIEAGPEGFLAAENTSNNVGRCRVAGFDAAGQGPDSQLDLVTITWKAVGVGATLINNTIDRLINSAYSEMGTPYTDNLTMRVYPIPLGDVNNDTLVNNTDALMIAQYCVGLNPSGFVSLVADTSEDGSIDLVDALLTAQYDLGIIPAVNAPLPSSEGGVGGQVWVDPILDKQVGEFCSTSIFVNCSSQICGAYHFDLLYDPSVLHINSVAVGPDGNFTTANINNTIGRTQIAGFDASGHGPSSALEILNITWEIIGLGESSLSNVIVSLVDNSTEPIGTPQALPWSANITEPQSPQITITSPSNNSCSKVTPLVNFTVFDTSPINAMWYSLNGSAPIPILNANYFSINETLWNDLKEGIAVLVLYANDTFGCIGEANLMLVKDTQAPSLTINSPLNETELSAEPPSINLTLADPHLQILSYRINNGSLHYLPSPIEGVNIITISEAEWEAVPEGQVVFHFIVNDTVGNEYSTDLTVSKEIESSGGVPAFDILALISLLALLGIGRSLSKKISEFKGSRP